MSWVFIISRAASADETTRIGTEPRWISMSGPPCVWDKEWREWCKSGVIWWRLPITGSFGGDGGRSVLVVGRL
ncbi:hypothetical protein HanIR_Chr16g0791071 [Helianthus annuus]|nr:hypothetical protein HanIR_Chr16g0791071 [Helianthus annuus]